MSRLAHQFSLLAGSPFVVGGIRRAKRACGIPGAKRVEFRRTSKPETLNNSESRLAGYVCRDVEIVKRLSLSGRLGVVKSPVDWVPKSLCSSAHAQCKIKDGGLF